MLKIKNISLYIKLLVPIFLLFLLIGGIVLSNQMNNSRLLDVQNQITENGLTRMSEISSILEDFQRLDGQFYRYLIYQSTGQLEDGEAKMAALKEEAIEINKELETLLGKVSGENEGSMLQLKSDFEANVIGLNNDGVYDVAMQMMALDVGFVLKGIGGYTTFYDEFVTALEDLKREINANVQAMSARSVKDIQSFQTYSLFVSLAISLIAVLFSLLAIFVVVRSIKDISETTTSLADGNLDQDLDSLERKDELGAIVVGLKQFKENQMRVKQLTEEQETLKKQQEEQRRREMLEMAENFDANVGSLINSLTTASEGMQITAENMKEIADKTVNASQNGASSSESANSNVNVVADAMDKMSEASNEITSQITSARTTSNQAAEDANKTSEAVGRLNKLVSNIGEVVTAIQDIAEQTNLLALNATIEAARAGEAGKGFAVVADEVKKLASETGKKTEEISGRISEIQNATTNSVQAMERIISNISNIDESITGVSSAIEEQNATTSEILRSVEEASKSVSSVTEIINQVKAQAEETGGSSDSVFEATTEVAQLSNDLKRAVDEFLKKIRDDNTMDDAMKGALEENLAELQDQLSNQDKALNEAAE